jgi:hypothetical protein
VKEQGKTWSNKILVCEKGFLYAMIILSNKIFEGSKRPISKVLRLVYC